MELLEWSTLVQKEVVLCKILVGLRWYHPRDNDTVPLQITMEMGRDHHSVPRGMANGIERVGLS